jgi:hypothetical protein
MKPSDARSFGCLLAEIVSLQANRCTTQRAHLKVPIQRIKWQRLADIKDHWTKIDSENALEGGQLARPVNAQLP